MRNVLIASCVAVALAGCTLSADQPGEDEAATEDGSEATASDAMGDATSNSTTGDRPSSENFAQTMPARLRGDWHKDDLGRAPTAKDCDPRLRGTIDWDRLITVGDGGYSYFETGGRILEVHNRTDTMIDATFDTTYADTPTSERRDFALQPDGTMAVNKDDGDGVMDVTQYIRCPE